MKSLRLLRLASVSTGLVLAALLAGCATSSEQTSSYTSRVVLGSPASRPANLDPRYTPQAMQEAFADGCQKAGIRIVELAVDESEYPYVLYGALQTSGGHGEVKAAVEKMPPGYRYVGSATSRRDGLTLFVLDVIPREQSPDRAEAMAVARTAAQRRMDILRQLDPYIRVAERGATGN